MSRPQNPGVADDDHLLANDQQPLRTAGRLSARTRDAMVHDRCRPASDGRRQPVRLERRFVRPDPRQQQRLHLDGPVLGRRRHRRLRQNPDPRSGEALRRVQPMVARATFRGRNSKSITTSTNRRAASSPTTFISTCRTPILCAGLLGRPGIQLLIGRTAGDQPQHSLGGNVLGTRSIIIRQQRFGCVPTAVSADRND